MPAIKKNKHKKPSRQRRKANLDDPVWGATEFAAVLRRSPKQVFNLLHGGYLDADKVAGRWASTRRRLLARFQGGNAAA